MQKIMDLTLGDKCREPSKLLMPAAKQFWLGEF
jgi:hypothetical protein